VAVLAGRQGLLDGCKGYTTERKEANTTGENFENHEEQIHDFSR
jgi:hypothetical protein